jgi:hypothetical protein
MRWELLHWAILRKQNLPESRKNRFIFLSDR